MEELRRMNLVGWVIAEHLAEGDRTGRVAYHSVNGNGSFGVGWSHGTCNLTTGFHPPRWQCHIDLSTNTVYLTRLAPDPRNENDLPSAEAYLYTISKPA